MFSPSLRGSVRPKGLSAFLGVFLPLFCRVCLFTGAEPRYPQGFTHDFRVFRSLKFGKFRKPQTA